MLKISKNEHINSLVIEYWNLEFLCDLVLVI